jgi:hypothetical protein
MDSAPPAVRGAPHGAGRWCAVKVPHPHTQYALIVLAWSSFAGGLIAGKVDGPLSAGGLLVAVAGVAAAHWLVPDPERVALMHRGAQELSGEDSNKNA